MFFALKESIFCVVLNACYSEQQAKAIANHIDCVIGMSKAISDAAAISFSTSFYQALGYGKDVKTAFNLGCGQIDLESCDEYETAKLFILKSNQNLQKISTKKKSANEKIRAILNIFWKSKIIFSIFICLLFIQLINWKKYSEIQKEWEKIAKERSKITEDLKELLDDRAKFYNERIAMLGKQNVESEKTLIKKDSSSLYWFEIMQDENLNNYLKESYKKTSQYFMYPTSLPLQLERSQYFKLPMKNKLPIINVIDSLSNTTLDTLITYISFNENLNASYLSWGDSLMPPTAFIFENPGGKN